jgi:type IV secretory pathway VirJ component
MVRRVKFEINRLLLVIVCLTAFLPWHNTRTEALSEQLSNPVFGEVTVLRPATPLKGIVLLLAPGMAATSPWHEAAMAVARLDYLVAFIDSDSYLLQLSASELPCVDVAADLSALGALLADRFQQPRERLPLILGFRQGAALTYTAVNQAAAADFHTAISVDFCPWLAFTKPFCPQHRQSLAVAAGSTAGVVRLLPAAALADDWFVFQSTAERLCDPAATAAFIKQIPGARLTPLTGGITEHGRLSGQITALLRWLDPRNGS